MVLVLILVVAIIAHLISRYFNKREDEKFVQEIKTTHEVKNFNTTKSFISSGENKAFNFSKGEPFIEINETDETINFPTFSTYKYKSDKKKFLRYRSENDTRNFKEIIDFELLEDGDAIVSGASAAGAIIGGVAFGGVGAIVGSMLPNKSNKKTCTSLVLRLAFNNINQYDKQLSFLHSEIKRSDPSFKVLYSDIQSVISFLTVIIKQNNSDPDANKQILSSADELLKYKQLLDMGAITQEEFDNKKAELL